MKTLRCPLCGNELTSIFRMTKTGSLKNKYGCLICGWETFELRKNENLAWKDAKEFISKFPPIMRSHQGDNLKLDFEDDVLTLIGKDTSRGKLYLQNCDGDVEIATPDDVEEWPWELKQEGGDNGQ